MARTTGMKELSDKLKMRGMVTNDAAIVTIEIGTTNDISFSASGTSKRSSSDRFVRGVGETLATARALENLARKLRKEVEPWL